MPDTLTELRKQLEISTDGLHRLWRAGGTQVRAVSWLNYLPQSMNCRLLRSASGAARRPQIVATSFERE